MKGVFLNEEAGTNSYVIKGWDFKKKNTMSFLGKRF